MTHKKTKYYDKKKQNHFLLETQLVWARSVNLKNFIQNVNKQYETNLRILMDTFELGKNQRTRKTTPVVRVTYEDNVIVRKIYTESITKKKSGLSH